jgi:hypothetical protein
MDKEKKVINLLKKDLNEIIPLVGLKIEILSVSENSNIDFKASLSYHNLKAEIWAEISIVESISLFAKKISQIKSLVAAHPKVIPVIVSYYLSEQKRNYCKEKGIYFIDLSGNVFLVYQSLFIERIGFSNKYPERRKGRSPFSDKASLILREFFKHRNKYYGVREIAEAVGLDPGYVSRIAKELVNRNYVLRKNSKLKIREPKVILEDWSVIYNYKKNQMASYFSLDKQPAEILKQIQKISKNIDYALSLQAGANLLLPFSVYNEVHIYLQDVKSEEIIMQELDLKKVDKGANIFLMRPYYKNSVLYDKQLVQNMWIVSDVQLYIDIYNYPLRGLEQAEQILNQRILKS